MTPRSGIDNGEVSLMSSGPASLFDAIKYLFEVGHRNRLDASFFERPFCQAERARRPSRVDALDDEVATLTMQLLALEAEVAVLTARLLASEVSLTEKQDGAHLYNPLP